MKDNKYEEGELYIVHKTIDNIDEIFLCIKLIDCYRDIFTSCLFEKGQFTSAESIKDYYDSLENNKNCYYDLNYWIGKYNHIKKMNNQSVFEIDPLSDVSTYNNWYNLELLRKYNIRKLFIVIKDDSQQIHICKCNKLFKKFIDIFTLAEIKISVNDNIIILDDYLRVNNIKNTNSRLNIYSLLRLYNQVNRIEDNKNISKVKQLSKLP